jgi:hypothetical protein
MQETFPQVMIQLTKEQIRNIQPQVTRWIEFSREIYRMPELGCDPPSNETFARNPPPHLLSDQIRKSVGKYNPFFDFVNAPFTHPIGTEISFTCINSAWNAYDTFIKELIVSIKTGWPDDRRVLALIQAETEMAKAGGKKQRVQSDTKLGILGIEPSEIDFKRAARDTESPHFEPNQVNLLTVAGKGIRSTVTHHGGEPTDRLKAMMQEHSDEELGFRITAEGFEVTLLAAKKIIEVIFLRATVIDAKRHRNFIETQSVLSVLPVLEQDRK